MSREATALMAASIILGKKAEEVREEAMRSEEPDLAAALILVYQAMLRGAKKLRKKSLEATKLAETVQMWSNRTGEKK